MAWWQRRSQEDFEAEIRAHIEFEAEQLRAEGVPREEALAAARKRFGNVTTAQERFHDARRLPFVDALVQDLRYAARQVRRAPLFAGGVVLTLALGIGANAVIFGVVDRLLLSPPPHVRDPDRLKRIYFRETGNALDGSPRRVVSTTAVTAFPMIVALQREVPALEEVAGVRNGVMPYTLGRGPEAHQVDLSLVTGNYFRVLGVRPALGRFFLPEEAAVPRAPQVAVASYGFWRRHLGGDRDAIGRQIRLASRTFTVVGVAPKGFTGIDLANVDLWVPAGALAEEIFGEDWATNSGWFWVYAIGRIRPGATAEQARAEATTVFRRTLRSWDQPWRDTAGTVVTGPIVAARGPEGAPAEAKVSLWLVGVSGIVLLIACANVANLLLARGVRRRREIAVRLAVGVSRGRLVKQLLTEAALLALVAAAAALLLAHWGGGIVRSVLLPAVAWGQSGINWRVVGFTLLLTCATAILAGLIPAIQASKGNLADVLKTGGRDTGGRRSVLQQALFVGQAALSVVLLVGAGLFVRSLWEVRSLDVGVDLPNVLLVRMPLARQGFEGPRIRDLYQLAAERARRVPGVEYTALLSATVPTSVARAAGFEIPGRRNLPELPGGGPYFGVVSAEYFAALGARIVRGRDFTAADERTGARVLIVNEVIAKHYWPGENPVGRCVKWSGSDTACTEVVGVVQDVFLFQMVGDERAQTYVTFGFPAVSDQDRIPEAMLVRVRGDARPVAALVRRELQTLAPDMPYVDARTFEELVAPQLQPWRLGATMFSLFGVLALVIAAVGLYSVLAYAVGQRVQEIGLRIALGAPRAAVIRLVVRDGATASALGLGLGVLLALAAAKWVEPMLFETSPRDPAVLAAVTATLLAVALAASVLPAWRAARVDPTVALRAE